MDEREKLRAAAGRVRAGESPADLEREADEFMAMHADDMPEGEDEGQAAETETLLLELESQKADLTDRLLRAAAEMDNLRKRSEREVSDAKRFAVAKFAGDMLVVNDNLQRALQSVPEEVEQDQPGPVSDFIKGVEVTSRELVRAMEKYGVTEIAALGEKFNPHLHEALFEAPIPGTPDGTVIEVIEKGYTIGDRILRAAKVGVAKGGQQVSEAAGPDAA